MKKTTMVFVVAIATSACGGGTPAPASSAGAGASADSAAAPAPAPAASASASSGAAPAGSAASTGNPGAAAAASAPPATGGSVMFGDIASAKSFDPKKTLTGLQDQLLACYNKERGAKPDLRGKLRMRAIVNQSGTVVNAEPEEGGLSKETGLVDCVAVTLKAAAFPKPGGMATVSIPLLFRP